MSFIGAIPEALREIIAEYTRDWTVAGVTDVYVGCCGNFTVERVLAGKFRLHSNDVSLYTSALGAYFAGQPFDIALSEEGLQHFPWLADTLDSPLHIAATVMLALKISDCLDGKGGLRTNRYYTRVYDGLRRNWPALFESTVTKLEKLGLQLASYAAQDVMTWFPEGQAFISFPPFYDTKTGGYNRLYRNINRVFDWQSPSFQAPDLKRFAQLVKACPHWIIATKDPVEELQDHLKAFIKPTNRNVPFYVYSSGGKTHVVQPSQLIQSVNVPRLEQGQTIGDRLTIAKLGYAEFDALRAQYLNQHIAPGQADAPFGVLVDGKLIGAFAFGIAPNPSLYSDLSYIYLMTDFAVAPTDYPRLSKLVVMALLSQESKRLAERTANRRIRAVVTSAFSVNPISMKYRGLLELAWRKPIDDPYWKFVLQYQGPMGQLTLAESLAEWKRKHEHSSLADRSA